MATKLENYGRYGLNVIKYPSGRFGFVGTLPEMLTEERTQKNGLKYNCSKVFNTENEAILYFESIKNTIQP